jgi:hypothetical protein
LSQIECEADLATYGPGNASRSCFDPPTHSSGFSIGLSGLAPTRQLSLFGDTLSRSLYHSLDRVRPAIQNLPRCQSAPPLSLAPSLLASSVCNGAATQFLLPGCPISVESLKSSNLNGH